MTRGGTLTVLHLVANRWWTGSAEPVIQLMRGLSARGHRVLLGLIRGDRFEQKAREAGFEPLPGLSLEARVNPLGLLRDLSRLRSLVKAERVDLIHCHHSHDHWLGWLCARPAALVRTFHNVRAVRSSWPSTALYRGTHAAIAVSREIEDRCRGAGIAAAAVHRIDGVVDLARFAGPTDGAWLKRELGVTGGPVVGSVARLAANRHHETLIRGFRLLLPDYPGARLLLVGKGEARPRLEALAQQLALTERVLFVGYRDTDLPDILHALDAFVLMDAGSDESGRAVLEAMAAARPVVARRVGALPDTVVHGVTGLLLDDDTPEAVARALRAVLEASAPARRMGEAGRRRAEDSFSPARHAEHVETVYGAALARRARAR